MRAAYMTSPLNPSLLSLGPHPSPPPSPTTGTYASPRPPWAPHRPRLRAEDEKNLAVPLKEGGCPLENSMCTPAGTTPTLVDRVGILSLSTGKFVNRLIRQNDKSLV